MLVVFVKIEDRKEKVVKEREEGEEVSIRLVGWWLVREQSTKGNRETNAKC